LGAPDDVNIEVVPLSSEPLNLRGYYNRLRRPMPEYRQEAFVRRIAELASTADVIHLEEEQTVYSSDGARTPTVARLHCLVRRDRSLGWPWQQARWGLECLLAERAACRRHRYLIANSPLVADALRRSAPDAEILLAPISVDTRYYPRAPLDGPPTAGMIGTGSWPPTARAIERLVARVWPLVRKTLPDAKLLIAGRKMEKFRSMTRAPGVEFLGEVDSAAEFFGSLSVLLYPLSRGSGMKVKVVEAMACGVPVVTTPVGAEGIDADGGVIVEDDDRALAVEAAAILSDETERQQRGSAVRHAFELRYAPAPAAEPVADLYKRMAG
jgi:glycosyltransferase involved in cell wall biosynthesis